MPAQCADSGFRGGAQPVNLQYFKSKGLVNPVVVSPDAGGVKRAKTFMEGAFPPPEPQINPSATSAWALGASRCNLTRSSGWWGAGLNAVGVPAGLAMIIKQRAVQTGESNQASRGLQATIPMENATATCNNREPTPVCFLWRERCL